MLGQSQQSPLDLTSGDARVSSWLPDETLFSLCSRHHWLLGSRRDDDTCRTLFGHGRQGCSHDFPARLDHFVDTTDGRFGTAEDIIHKRTVLNFFLAFRKPADAADAVASCRAGGLGGIKARLGMLASGLGASHPLRACPECMLQDTTDHGVAFWRRDHQWPGCFVCLRHGCLLQVARAKTNGYGRFAWFLPSEVDFLPIADKGSESQQQSRLLRRIAECSAATGRLPWGFHFATGSVHRALLVRVRDLGLLRGTDSLRVSELSGYLAEQLGCLSGIRGFEAMRCQSSDELALPYLRLLREPRGTPHPLRYVLLAASLFESFTLFFKAYREEEGRKTEAAAAEVRPHESTAVPDPRRLSLLQAINAGRSIRAAAGVVGVAVATAMAWAAQEGIRTPRRPKQLSADKRRPAVSRLKRGQDKAHVADAAGVSTQTITLLLRTEPGLQDSWRSARHERRKRVARAAWTRTARALATPSPKTLRDLQPAVFAWLYRNDRAWLEDFAAKLHVTPRTNRPSVKWDQRDVELSNLVRQAALVIVSASHRNRVRLSDLCDAIPDLKGRLSKLDRLPLTRRTLREATSTHPAP